MTAKRRGAGRPSTPLLSQEQIVDAAFHVLSDSGADDFTMSQLAAHLGVQPPALYNHVRNRREVVNLMRLRVAAQIDSEPFKTRPWNEAIVPWAHSYRDVFARNRHAIALLATVPMDGTETSLRMYEPVVQGFLRGGWPLPQIVPVIVALESYIIGSSLDVIADPESMDPRDNVELAPTFAAAVQARDEEEATRGVAHADHAFEIGLEAMILGLEARLGRFEAPDPAAPDPAAL